MNPFSIDQYPLVYKSQKMKNLGITLLGACLFGCMAGSAQTVAKKALPINEPDYNKPKLFADLPDKIGFNPNDFVSLFASQVGQSVNVSISQSFILSGQLVSKSENAQSATVVIRSINRGGARFIFTRVSTENNSAKYLGRIISLSHADSYEISSENNQYYFKKKSIYDVISE